jgi:hypothetical protein
MEGVENNKNVRFGSKPRHVDRCATTFSCQHVARLFRLCFFGRASGQKVIPIGPVMPFH